MSLVRVYVIGNQTIRDIVNKKAKLEELLEDNF
jgi:hypothetical protein